MRIKWQLAPGWGTRPLGEIAPEDSRQIKPSDFPEQDFNYWSLDAIGKGQFTEPRPNIVKGAEILSVCNEFQPHHVLYSKLRPLLNKVITPSVSGIGSTEWVVLKPNPALVDRYFLAYVLRTTTFVNFAARSSTGARQPRVPKDVLWNADIPLPYPDNPKLSVATQRRIVARIEALLAEVREMREINQRIIGDTQQLLGAFLFQTFDQLPEKENKTIDEIGFVKGGKRLPKGESFSVQPTPYPYLRVTDFRNLSIDESDLRYLTPEVYAQTSHYTISDQDVFISIAGTIGLVGTVPTHLSGSNLTENAAKIVFRPEYQGKIKNKYLMYYLASPQAKKQIEERTKAAGQPKLALERIKTITFPYIESITQQELIIEKIEAVQSEVIEMLKAQQAHEKFINQLEESILAQAFRGEL